MEEFEPPKSKNFRLGSLITERYREYTEEYLKLLENRQEN